MACEKQLSKKEQAAAQANFEYWQAEYNKTGDKNIVWNNLLPIFRNALGPAILKGNMHHFVQNFEEKLDNAALTLVGRYLKNKDYNYNSLATLVYWAALAVNRKQSTIDEEMFCLSKCSFEDLFTENADGEPVEHYDHIMRVIGRPEYCEDDELYYRMDELCDGMEETND